MKKRFIFILILLCTKLTFAQTDSLYSLCITKLDTIQESDFFEFSDTNECSNKISKTITGYINNFQDGKFNSIINMDDLTSYRLFSSKNITCDITKYFLLSGFKIYLLTIDKNQTILDIKNIGENSPTLFEVKTGIGKFTRTKSYFADCSRIVSIISTYVIDKEENVLLKQTIHNYSINNKGQINKEL